MTKENVKIYGIFAAYLISIVFGNLLVFWLGRWGILLTSFIFIPFDFVIRCYIHEKFRQKKLYLILFGIISAGGLLTFACNYNAGPIAIASVVGFALAGISGSIFYQNTIKKHTFLKVNGSDLLAIVVDSITFQIIAFGSINVGIITLQILIKAAGGFLWYYILFIRLGFIDSINQTPQKAMTLLKKTGDWQRISTSNLIEYSMPIEWFGEHWALVISFYGKRALAVVGIMKRYEGGGYDISSFVRFEITGPYLDLSKLKENSFKAARLHFKNRGDFHAISND